MTRLTCFPMLGTGYRFSHTWLVLHVFLCLTLVTCFPTHDLPYMFSLLTTGYMFSHTRLDLHVFLCLTLVTCTCFLLLGSEASASHFPLFLLLYDLELVTCFLKLDSIYFRFLAWHGLIHCVNFCFSCDWLTSCEYFGVWFIRQLFLQFWYYLIIRLLALVF